MNKIKRNLDSGRLQCVNRATPKRPLGLKPTTYEEQQATSPFTKQMADQHRLAEALGMDRDQRHQGMDRAAHRFPIPDNGN